MTDGQLNHGKSLVYNQLQRIFNNHVEKIRSTEGRVDTCKRYSSIKNFHNKTSKYTIMHAKKGDSTTYTLLIKAKTMNESLGTQENFNETFMYDVLGPHPNIVAVSMMFITFKTHLMIEMERCWESVHELAMHCSGLLLQPDSPPPDVVLSFTPSVVKTIFRQIVSGLEFIRKKNIIHKDIKPQNILLTREFVWNGLKGDAGVKICDFECSGLLNFGDDMCYPSYQVNATPYRPPEVVLMLPFSFSTDVFAAGCTLAFMLNVSINMPPKKWNYPFRVPMNLRDHLSIIDSIVGPIPDDMIREHAVRYRPGDPYYICDPSADPNIDSTLVVGSHFNLVFAHLLNHTDEDVVTAANLLKLMMHPAPSARIAIDKIKFDQYLSI